MEDINWYELINFNPDVIGITAMTLQIEAAAKLADRFKMVLPESEIVIGGVHVSAEPLTTLTKYPQFDHAIIGEGEKKFLELIGDTYEYSSLDDLPFPDYNSVDLTRYRLSPVGTKSRGAVGLVTSRGCFGKCSFCSKCVFGSKINFHSAGYVLKLMKNLNRDHNVTDFLFYDDLFVGNRKRLIEFCETILKERLPFTWSCCSRVDTLDDSTLRLMKRSGCWMIEFGIESGNQQILNSMKKNITKEQVSKAIEMTRKAGIKSKGNFIFGYPGETEKTLNETIDFACSLPLDYFQHTFMTPLPGTEVYKDNPIPWADCNTFRVNYIAPGLTKELLLKYSKKAFMKFYLRPHMILKQLMNPTKLKDGFKAFWKAVMR